MRLSIIAAVAANRAIGRDNRLPWRLSGDLKWFKALTLGHHLIMGRKTFASIGRPLPGRTTIVITHDPTFAADGVETASSVDQAIMSVRGDDDVFICGGAEIYLQTIHIADRMFITQVHADVAGDAFFPDFDDVNEWRLIDREDFEADEKNDYPFSFLTYERIAPEGHAIPEEG